jgi:hypothetical protein
MAEHQKEALYDGSGSEVEERALRYCVVGSTTSILHVTYTPVEGR